MNSRTVTAVLAERRPMLARWLSESKLQISVLGAGGREITLLASKFAFEARELRNT